MNEGGRRENFRGCNMDGSACEVFELTYNSKWKYYIAVVCAMRVEPKQDDILTS